jgi:hypothetical protein
MSHCVLLSVVLNSIGDYINCVVSSINFARSGRLVLNPTFASHLNLSDAMMCSLLFALVHIYLKSSFLFKYHDLIVLDCSLNL